MQVLFRYLPVSSNYGFRICTHHHGADIFLEASDKGLFHNQEKLDALGSFWQKYGHTFKKNTKMNQRFTSSLYYAVWNWEEVYKMEELL